MRWKDVETPWLPLGDDGGPRGQGSFQKGTEKQVGDFGGLKVSAYDIEVARRHYDHSIPWPVFRDAWFTRQAQKHRKSLTFLRRLRARCRDSISRRQKASSTKTSSPTTEGPSTVAG